MRYVSRNENIIKEITITVFTRTFETLIHVRGEKWNYGFLSSFLLGTFGLTYILFGTWIHKWRLDSIKKWISHTFPQCAVPIL